jgi:hypothetical protein
LRVVVKMVVKMASYFSLPAGGPKAYSRRKILSPIVVDATMG